MIRQYFLQRSWLLFGSAIALISVFSLINLLFPRSWLIKLLSPAICPGAVYFQTTDRPIVALTIDDSPDPQTTAQILSVLARYNVVATFFPISDLVQKNPDLIQAIADGGHEIGNHLTTDEPSIKLDEKFPL